MNAGVRGFASPRPPALRGPRRRALAEAVVVGIAVLQSILLVCGSDDPHKLTAFSRLALLFVVAAPWLAIHRCAVIGNVAVTVGRRMGASVHVRRGRP